MKIYIRGGYVSQNEYDQLVLIPSLHQWFADRGYSYNLTGEQFMEAYEPYYAIIMEDDVYVHLKLDGFLTSSSF